MAILPNFTKFYRRKSTQVQTVAVCFLLPTYYSTARKKMPPVASLHFSLLTRK